MRATIRYFHSPDIDIDNYQPGDPTNVGFLLQLFVGPSDGQGEESFDVVVCTPKWLQEQVMREGAIFGRHHLVVDRYDVDFIKQTLIDAVNSQKGADWPTLALKLATIGRWEFEDYAKERPDSEH